MQIRISKRNAMFLIEMYVELFILFFASLQGNRVSMIAFCGICTFILVTKKRIKPLLIFFMAVLPNFYLYGGSLFGITSRHIIIAVCVVYLLKNINSVRNSEYKCVNNAYMILWLVYFLLNTFIINTGGTFNTVILLVLNILFAVTMPHVIASNREDAYKVFMAFLVGVSFIAIIAVIELMQERTFFYSLWVGHERYRNGIIRPGSTVADPNNICFILVPSLFVLLLPTARERIFSLFRVGMIVLCVAIILLSSSRTGMIALIAGVSMYFLARKRLLLLFALPVIIAVSDMGLNILDEYMQLYSESTSFRFDILAIAMQEWRNYPFFGIGAANLNNLLGRSDLNTMNTYVNSLLCYGSVGFGFLLLYWMQVISKDVSGWLTKKKVDIPGLLKLCSVGTLLILAFSLDTIGMSLMWILPVVFIADEKISRTYG